MNYKFPKDVPVNKVIKVFKKFGFNKIREGNHISFLRKNPDGSNTPMTIPNHPTIKDSTLRHIINQAGIKRNDFLKIFYKEI